MKHSKYSIVIIGSGIAGLYTALKVQREMDLHSEDILLVSKSNLQDNNSFYAQGGIAGVLKENTQDSVDLHVNDTMNVGNDLNEESAVRFISENSDTVIKDLLNFGVDFDRDKDDNFLFTLEAAHSVKRILHSGGDATGRNIELGLLNTLQKNKKISIYEKTTAVEILIDDNQSCKGVILFDNKTKQYEVVYSSVVVLATGGVGQLYKYTTNPIGATGDGIALAYNAGAVLRDIEFIQFHPTALAVNKDKNRFLISEAVRGEGAKLINTDGMRFMQKYDARQELAPRDVVTRANYTEILNKQTENVYLDATCINKDVLLNRFPTIYKVCLKYGIDITKDLIPVAPAAHYFMGGIKAEVDGQTSIKNLYAIGEVASTGLHGGNRLASNSLLECVVCAYKFVKNLKNKNLQVNDSNDENIIRQINKYTDCKFTNYADIQKCKAELQNIMWNGCGIFRDETKLTEALTNIENLAKRFVQTGACQSREEYEFGNMLTVAKLIITAALARKESRGAHYRTDYLQTDKKTEHTIIKK